MPALREFLHFDRPTQGALSYLRTATQCLFYYQRYVLFLLVLTRIHGQSTDSKKPSQKNKSVEKNQIEVVAEAPAKGVEGTFQKVQLKNSQNRFENNISQVLRNEPGFQINRFGAPGSFSAVSIRAASPSQTNVYLDGMPLNSALGGAVNLENIPVEMFESAELYRSYIPFHLSGANIGGAVDLIPVLPQEDQGSYLFLNSFGTSLYGGGIGLGYADHRQMHYVNLEGSLNRYIFNNDQGTRSINFEDDTKEIRRNEDYKSVGYTGLARIPVKKNAIKILADLNLRERGLPGVIGAPLDNVRLLRNRAVLRVSGDFLFNDWILLKPFAGFSLGHSLFTDPDQELPAGLKRQERLAWQTEAGVIPTFYLAGEKLVLSFSVSDTYNRLNLDGASLAERNAIETGSSLEFTPMHWLGRLIVSGKYIWMSDSPREPLKNLLLIDPALDKRNFQLKTGQARLSFFPVGILRKIQGKKFKKTARVFEAFASLKYSERPPSLSESYGNGDVILPSPGLVQEKSKTWSTGVTGALPCGALRCQLYTAWFHTESQDLIVFIQNSQRTSIAFNIASTLSRGLESQGEINYKHYITLRLKASYIEAADKGDISFYRDKRIPFIPGYTLGAYIESGTESIRIFANTNLQGKTYLDRFNQEDKAIASRLQIDTGITWIIDKSPAMLASFMVRNITNQLAPDIFGYPLPGRYYEVHFKKRFQGETKDENKEK